jgi:choline kinase
MRAIILSAGRGSRLLRLTEDIPKCLVPVGGRAILDHQLKALAAAGVGSAIVVAGYRYDQVASHLAGNTPPLPVDLRFNPFWAVSSSIGSVWTARDALVEPFCLLNGDTTLRADIFRRALTSLHDGLGLVVEPIVTPALDDMLVAVAGQRVTAVSKQLDLADATHRSLGVIVGSRGNDYSAALAAVIAGPDGLHAYHHDIIDALARRGEVTALVERSRAWTEIDNPEDIENWKDRFEGVR